MKNILLFLFCALAANVSAQEVIDVEVQDMQTRFILSFVVPFTPEYDVQNYKVQYTTTDAFGQPDTASGLVTIPITPEDLSFPIAVYNHGTVGGEREAVLSRQGIQERFFVAAVVTSGYIGLAPDYLGLGDSDGRHPYVHAETEASAGRDMVIAVKKWLAEDDIAQFNEVFRR